MSPNAAVRSALEEVYQVFAGYPLIPSMEGSPLYTALAQWNRGIAAKPLRSLSVDDLQLFYFKVLTTWGNTQDFKHFLPRILELLTTYPLDWEEWVALDKLNYAQWRTWPAAEQQAIQRYLLVFWQELLTSTANLADASIDAYFPAIANVYPDFGALLAVWTAMTSEVAVAVRRLVNFVYRAPDLVLEKQVLPGFYPSPERGRIFYKWLLADEQLATLEKSFFATADEGWQQQLSIVLGWLEKHKRAL